MLKPGKQFKTGFMPKLVKVTLLSKYALIAMDYPAKKYPAYLELRRQDKLLQNAILQLILSLVFKSI
jgi:hypothetical protein